MERIAVSGFDLAATLQSGQAFHWLPAEEGFVGAIGDVPAWISQPEPGLLLTRGAPRELVEHYLALDHDIPAFRRTLPKGDRHLQRALRFAPGIRLLRQPRWECLASFITSSLKQVVHIRQISLRLREKWGRPLPYPGNDEGVLFAYPTPDAIASAGEQALRACGLGYRARFLHATAVAISSGAFDLDAVASLDDEAACARLCELPGVGPKIAQCTLLFSFERLGMFPIDVWIERALRELYFPADPAAPKAVELRDFARRHFGPYRGYAQQWLFHHARTGGLLD